MSMIPATASSESFLADMVLQILLFTGITMLCVGTAAAVGLWLVIRRIRRSRRLRYGLRSGALTVRSYTKDDAGRRLARQRLGLQRSAEATRRALAAAFAERRFVGELPLVADRLHAASRSLDEQLKLAEGEPEPGVKRSLAASLDSRVQQLNRLSGELRQNLMEAGYSADAEQLELAGKHLSREIEALHAWSSAYRGTSGSHGSYIPTVPLRGWLDVRPRRRPAPAQRRPNPTRS
ncbi:hypothetical protein [Arthrobacter sp. NPDC089319]|uniref:hypothetical protein n=1 Tax=Arthrobacter sp. NPDC089319 TaxID=3155915 RepID=UPI00344243C1